MFRFLTFPLLFLFGAHPIFADVIVRMEVQQDAAIDTVHLRLFEDTAPQTVANFLDYVNGTTVNGGSYDNSFIHRSVSNFVVQGGGFTFDPALNDGSFSYDEINDVYPGGLQEVPADPPVQNEFDRSNLRGTVAMAKLGGDPNSATSEWFINLADNSSNLDGQNGGFTVFGEVMSDGMTIVDQIASHPKYDKTDIHSAFGELPLITYTDLDPVVQQNLVRINTMTDLLSITSDIDFNAVLINTSVQSVITIRNLDTVDHSIGDIATTDTLAAPFVIFSDTCANTPLPQDQTCTIVIEFSPVSENVFNDSFNIELTDPGLSYSFALAGKGAFAADITPSLDAIEFGDTQLFDPLNGFPDQIVLFVNNDGGLDLNITSVTLGGTDASDFEVIDNCTTFSPLTSGSFCVLPVNFKPLTTGEKSASLTLVSDDPDESPLIIPITGTASLDTDGVPVAVEDGVYNDGDGNNDNVLDSLQNDVASFPAENGTYITLLTSFGARISDISVLSRDQLVEPPDGVQFDLGVMDFTIDNVFAGVAEVGVILPPGYIPSTYYMYGPTPDNTNPHWYEFLFDGTTGAILIGNAAITAPDGSTVQRHLIRLVFVDGQRGDADLTVNGVIVDPGAPVVALENPDSGSLGLLMLLLIPGIAVSFRNVGRKGSAG